MKGSQLNVILKYRRPADCWLCSDCESENNMLLGTCAVCGAKKDAGAIIIPAWNEREEYVPQPVPVNKAPAASGRGPVASGPVSRLGGTAMGGYPTAHPTGPSSAPISPPGVYGTGKPYSDSGKYAPVESGSSGTAVTIILSIILAIVVLGIIIAVANS